jgi:hypothetical protein
MRRYVGAVIAVICPLVMAGLLTACEMGYLSIENTVALCAGCIYAEWWGLTTYDSDDE